MRKPPEDGGSPGSGDFALNKLLILSHDSHSPSNFIHQLFDSHPREESKVHGAGRSAANFYRAAAVICFWHSGSCRHYSGCAGSWGHCLDQFVGQ